MTTIPTSRAEQLGITVHEVDVMAAARRILGNVAVEIVRHVDRQHGTEEVWLCLFIDDRMVGRRRTRAELVELVSRQGNGGNASQT